MEDNLNELLKEEKDFRSNKNYYECYTTCLKILDEIQSQSDDKKIEIISKIFFYQNQSNYVKINLINSLMKNFSFINNKTTKKKYYQLLINSFSKGKDKQYLIEISQIKKLFTKSEITNYIELDKYISNLVYEMINKSQSQNNSLNTMNSSINAETSISNLSLKSTFLITDDDLKQNNDEITEKNSDMKNSIEESLSEDNNINNISKRRKVSEVKNLLKKYKPDPKAPMIIISVCANVNSNQFLNLLNDNFEKFKYHNICTIKNTERDNISIYEYNNKNCLSNFFNKICKSKDGINRLQVLSILKRDENNFDTGINSLLNDTYERKISIKTIKGNPQNSINIIVKFLRNFCINVEKIKVIKQSKCFLRYNLESELKNIISIHKNRIYKGNNSLIKKNSNDKIRSNSIDEPLVEKTNDSANRYYELYKVFSKKEYGLGKTVSEFIDNFKKDYKLDKDENNKIDQEKFSKIDTRTVMMKVINIFEISINTLNSTFNFNEKNTKSNNIYNTTFFANGSEQFILNKIYPELYNIYNIKYKKDNEKYLSKQKEINEKLTIDEIIKKIGLKQKLKGNDKIPFKRVIDIINKINFEKSLKKKYEIMTQASLEIRNCVLDNTNCKYELDSMDDELPIVIYITTQLKVNNLYAELYMIEDYIKCSLRDRLAENKTVTNLMSSLLFITNTWDKEMNND